ncbi:MAG: KTSC domain-containing protein [Rhodoferax sp.]|uniref:KTSC domain-containing protein n=1 Tax=Rhodoferax sp. TaxID=50421 RepID=UPI001B6B2926|nr:KTSC domain-containing protein [Rhodoferax sp.]MBP9737164.1 KTSC domain-containing protein [Rhodoferax sp.]
MTTKIFSSGRIRQAEYDTTTQALEIHWVDKTVLAYKQVPAEVFRRLCAAPNPAAYWEDRIAEEYPKGTPKMPRPGASNQKSLNDLFGDGT